MRGYWYSVEDLCLQLRNRKRNKDTSNGKRNRFLGKFIREAEEIRSEETWGWIKKGYLEKETEGLTFAAQKQALRTNWIRKNIDGQEVLQKCRTCEERDESITRLIAESKKLA